MNRVALNALVLGGIFTLALTTYACNEQSSSSDSDQSDAGMDIPKLEDNVSATDNATDMDAGTSDDGMTGGDDAPAEDSGLPSDIASVDSTVILPACPTGAGDNLKLPFITEFDDNGDMAANGWEIISPQSAATGMWALSVSDDFGSNRYAAFAGQEARVSRTGLVSECLDTSECAPATSATVQWRMSYRHADPSRTATLKLVAFDGTDLDAGEIVWTDSVSEDIDYSLFSAQLTASTVAAGVLRIALVIEFPDQSPTVVGKWSIDHIVVSCGQANINLKTLVYDCANPSESCSLTTAVKRDGETAPGTPVSLSVQNGNRSMIVLCGRDPDATTDTWTYYGHPGISMDMPPSDSPEWIFAASANELKNGCTTFAQQVALVCGTPAVTEAGYFFCAVELAPVLVNAEKTTFEPGLVVIDERSDNQSAKLHEPLESRVAAAVSVTTLK